MEPISIPDILAFADVLDALQLEAAQPGMQVDRAVELMDALAAAKKKLEMTVALLKSRAIIALEGAPRILGGKAYSVKPDRKKRPNHSAIRTAIIAAAQYDVDGERVESTYEAAGRAMQLTYDLFVADADVPKLAGLRWIRLPEDQAFSWETTGKTLKVTDLEGAE